MFTDERGYQAKYTYSPLGQEYETVIISAGNIYVADHRGYDAHRRLIQVNENPYGSQTLYAYGITKDGRK